MAANHLLGELSVAEFLQHYWQQQPLLIRQALPGFVPPLSADELAGLACEADVESRLILEIDGPAAWYLENGPFNETRFATLPASHWTLLVQDVDKYHPDVAEMLQQFRFVPDWRIDDIMISYAVDQGSVGPHVDNYDVFLLQASGSRRWKISQQPVPDDNFVPDIALNILREFETEQEWLLEPGDMLYLPPGIAHHGIAEGECMTWSIGFRAPSYAQLIGGFVDDYLASQAGERFYQDPGRALPTHPGELDQASLASLREIVRLTFLSDARIDEWLGRLVTEPKQADAVMPLETPVGRDQLLDAIERRPQLVRNPWARLAYQERETGLQLFAAGHSWYLDTSLLEVVQWLCDNSLYDLSECRAWPDNGQLLDLLTALINQGIILIDE